MCGGYNRQYGSNGGRCGVCGDPWDEPPPRRHEAGGITTPSPRPVRVYQVDGEIPVFIDSTADLVGQYEFRLCKLTNSNETPDQDCFDQTPLSIRESRLGQSYRIGQSGGLTALHLVLPENLTCTHCILQWRHVTGNRLNKASCVKCAESPEPLCNFCLGCGMQAWYQGCADIAIHDVMGSHPAVRGVRTQQELKDQWASTLQDLKQNCSCAGGGGNTSTSKPTSENAINSSQPYTVSATSSISAGNETATQPFQTTSSGAVVNTVDPRSVKMSGDEDGDERDAVSPVLPVVSIGSHSGSRSPLHDNHDEYSDITLSEDGDEEEDEDREGRRHRAESPDEGGTSTRQRFKTINGRTRINMTPPDQLLAIAQKKARKLASLKKADRAIKEYTRCIALTRIVHGDHHWLLAKSHVDLGEAYLDLKGYAPQAEFHAETAKSVMLHGAHVSDSVQEKAHLYKVLINMYYILGRATTHMKKYPEAEQYLMKADRIAAERSRLDCVSDEDCDKTDVRLFLAMAKLYGRQKKYAVAAEKYDKAIDLMEKVYGRDSLRLISVLHDYGKLEQSKGRHANHQKAIDLFQQAHDVATANYRQGSQETVDTALALAQAYANTGREEAEGSAESYLNECLANCTAIHGPHHPRSLMVQDELARLLIRTDRHEEAMTMLKSSINPKCQAFGDYSEQVSDTYKLMGSIHLSQGSIERALRAYKKCYGIEQLVLGKNHKKTKDTLRTMELLMTSPGIANKFVLNTQDELQKRPRFNSVVNTGTQMGGFKSQT
ncbi:tetratricopeptide repeat protein 23-like isoform X4 [Littorina saxatilis]